MKWRPNEKAPARVWLGQVTAVLSSIVLLASCAVLPGGGPAPLDTYDLAAPILAIDAPRHARTQLLIAEPSALKVLDDQNIVVKTAPGTIEYLSGAQWADRLPKIVQSRLSESFEAADRFGGVGKPGEGLAIDYQIVTEIRAFEIRVGGGDRATVELFVKVLNDRNGIVRAARAFQTSVPVSAAGNGDYIAALDQAFAATASQIVAWTASVI